jgi:hypothetical protein
MPVIALLQEYGQLDILISNAAVSLPLQFTTAAVYHVVHSAEAGHIPGSKARLSWHCVAMQSVSAGVHMSQ